ncbi:unnamed protein product [Parnassius apollo]|uniref:(apollo) hypothetical protein n=1 Tax=Parnassius apollo TaxID=110799 RepID=A0A8S3WUR4_PARAO|nr:unnamed protein product [Parnassius apollo]
MSTVDFEYLINKIFPLISKQDTQLLQALSAKMRLAITLRYLATGASSPTKRNRSGRLDSCEKNNSTNDTAFLQV